MLIKNGQRTIIIRCILTELLQCEVDKNADCQHFVCQDASDHHRSLTIFRQHSINTGVCELIFNWAFSVVT